MSASDTHSFATLLCLKRITRAMTHKVPLKVMAMLTQDLAVALIEDGKVVEGTQAAQQALVMDNLGELFTAIVNDLKPASLPPVTARDNDHLARRYRAMSWEDLG